VGDADLLVRGVHTSHIFVNQFGFVPRGFHTRGCGDESGQGAMVSIRRRPIRIGVSDLLCPVFRRDIFRTCPRVGAVGILTIRCFVL
jgi:hypothetical protein